MRFPSYPVFLFRKRLIVGRRVHDLLPLFRGDARENLVDLAGKFGVSLLDADGDSHLVRRRLKALALGKGDYG